MKYSVIILILSVLGLSSYGQESLTLNMCREKALEHDQTVKTAEADMDINVASLKLSKKAMLPQFDFSADYIYTADPQVMSIPSVAFGISTTSDVVFHDLYKQLTYNNMYNGGIDFSLPLYMGGKLQNYKKMAAFGVNMAEQNMENTKDNLVVEVDKKYWSLVSLKENILVIKKSVKLLEDIVRETNNRYKVGIVTKNEVLKTQVELNNSKLLLIQMNNNLDLATMDLNQSIGNSILDKVDVEDSVIIPEKEPVAVNEIENVASNRKELQILQGQIGITEADKNVARSDYLPQLVSWANYGFQNPNHLSEDETELTWTAGVSLSIPILHWGEKHLKVQQKKLATEKAELNYDKAKEGIILQIQQSAYKVNESLVKISFTKAALDQAEENLNLEKNRLDQGVVTTTFVLDAQVQWQKANSDYISAKVDYKINQSNYLKNIGQLNY